MKLITIQRIFVKTLFITLILDKNPSKIEFTLSNRMCHYFKNLTKHSLGSGTT